MLPSEILDCLNDFIKTHAVKIISLGKVNSFKISPFEVQEISALSETGTVFLAIGDGVIDETCTTFREFQQKNTRLLYITIGCKKNDSLKESVVSGFLSEDDIVLKKINYLFKKRLHKGGIARNPETGTSVEVPSHYYSDGAQHFEKNGGRLVAFAGNTIYSVI
jgi:hypothetical protein